MNYRRILGRIDREDFVGRDRELERIVLHPSQDAEAGALLLLAAPAADASELMRQAYDDLFARRGEAIPIYFALSRRDGTALRAARRFFTTFLQQYIAYRRVDPALCEGSPALNDLLDLALPTDYEWIARLVALFERTRAANDEVATIQVCFSAPERAATGRVVFSMIEGIHRAGDLHGSTQFGSQLAYIFGKSRNPYLLAGPRRHLLDLVRGISEKPAMVQTIRLEKLADDDARIMIERMARSQQVELNDQTRDLIVQQLDANPFFASALIQSARETNTPLTSFRNCQRLYVDELMGGQINRHFSTLLDELTSGPEVRRNLLRVLYDACSGETPKASLVTWKNQIGAETTEFERIIHQLHMRELINASASLVEVNKAARVWRDYLSASYRIEAAGESRALVVADTLVETLKRAPRTMARKYRRETALGLRELLAQFDCQEVPATLLDYNRFSTTYKGREPDQIDDGLEAETDLLRLPQIVNVAACEAFAPEKKFCDEERCVVGHGFDAADYTDANEVVWLAAEIESKLEASAELTKRTCDQLAEIARECGFARTQVWLIAPEGFSAEASALLDQLEAYGSSRQQVELLAERIDKEVKAKETNAAANEYELVIPMGGDTELIAAHAVEQVARRVNFQPEAINQIKTALIEACINAAEHSLSPDRKIYQRFWVENDKLVVTVGSRGVVPADMFSENGQGTNGEASNSRRGWGLKLIRTLMDEVEFQRVDDGTQLRMVKYIRKS
jgi:serine/threonine-protein kinase RsbW